MDSQSQGAGGLRTISIDHLKDGTILSTSPELGTALGIEKVPGTSLFSFVLPEDTISLMSAHSQVVLSMADAPTDHKVAFRIRFPNAAPVPYIGRLSVLKTGEQNDIVIRCVCHRADAVDSSAVAGGEAAASEGSSAAASPSASSARSPSVASPSADAATPSAADQPAAESDRSSIDSHVGDHAGPLDALPQRATKQRRTRPPPIGSSCGECRVQTSTEWRKGPDPSAVLCNACGLRYTRLCRRRQRERERFQAQSIKALGSPSQNGNGSGNKLVLDPQYVNPIQHPMMPYGAQGGPGMHAHLNGDLAGPAGLQRRADSVAAQAAMQAQAAAFAQREPQMQGGQPDDVFARRQHQQYMYFMMLQQMLLQQQQQQQQQQPQASSMPQSSLPQPTLPPPSLQQRQGDLFLQSQYHPEMSQGQPRPLYDQQLHHQQHHQQQQHHQAQQQMMQQQFNSRPLQQPSLSDIGVQQPRQVPDWQHAGMPGSLSYFNRFGRPPQSDGLGHSPFASRLGGAKDEHDAAMRPAS